MQANLLRCVPSFLIALPLVAQAPPQLPLTAEGLLPASTYAAVRFGGLAACGRAATSLPLAEVVHGFLHRVPAEVRAEHLDQHLDLAADRVRQGLQQAGLRTNDARGFLSRPMTLAMGRVSIEGMGPSVALIIEIGDQKNEINRVVQWSAQQLVRRIGGGESAEVDIDGHRFHSLVLAEGPSLFAGALGGHYIATNSRGFLREMIAVAAGKGQALTKSSRLLQLNEQLPAPALASLFVNTARVFSSFAPHLPYEAEEWSAALGLGQIDALYAATTASKGAGDDVLHLGIGGSEHGLMKALVATPVDLGFAQSCSANTVAFMAGSCDAPAVLAAFHRFAELLPASAREEMMAGLADEVGNELQVFGSSPQELHRVLQSFGTQVSVALALEKGAVPKPELLVRVAVRDRGVVGGLLQQLEAKVAEDVGLEWKTRKAGEHEVRFCNVPLPQANLQLSPCYVLTQDALWLGSDAQALVRAMRQDGADSLAVQPDFQDLVAASQGASGVMHLRLFRAAELGWRTVETWAYPRLDAHREEVGFGSDTLPDSEAVAKALGTATFLYRVDDDGVTLHSRGTFTFGTLLAALGACGDEVLSRATGKVY